MYKNKLQLNDAKTEIMLICSVHNHSTFNVSHIQVGDSEIQPVSVVRNIGAELDETLSMRSHVNSLCSRRALLLAEHQQDTTPGQEDNSNACSCLCNIAVGPWECLALWTPSNSAIQGARRVHNAAARLVCLTGRRDHITPVLR